MLETWRRLQGRPESAQRRHPRLLLAGSLVYVGLVFGVMLWRGISIEPQWVALALLVIAAALGRGRQFIFDFVPFLLLFFAYEVMRGFAAKTGFTPHDLSGWERTVFFGRLPTEVLQAAFYSPDRGVDLLDLSATFFYFMHFVLPVAAGFLLWLSSRERYWRYVAALLLLSFVGFVTYLFFPSTPPWKQLPEVHKILDATISNLWGIGYFVSPLYTNLNPNRYAAFPSLHAAFPALAVVYMWGSHRRVALALIVWTACVWLSIVYLGEHYVIDALAGLVYMAGAVVVVEVVARRRAARSDRQRRLIALSPP